jgi:aerobic-type carbon monoxide dehydrogenase small subunit (CoxS/CutS family)
MPETVTVTVNEKAITVSTATTVAVAVVIAGAACRISVTGEPRGPLCAMGICFECRVLINGAPHQRSCQILCQQGMDVRTQ